MIIIVDDIVTASLHAEAILEYFSSSNSEVIDSPNSIFTSLSTNVYIINLLRGEEFYLQLKVIQTLFENSEFRLYARKYYDWNFIKVYRKEYCYSTERKYGYGVNIYKNDLYSNRCYSNFENFRKCSKKLITDYFLNLHLENEKQLVKEKKFQYNATKEKKKQRNMIKLLSNIELLELNTEVKKEILYRNFTNNGESSPAVNVTTTTK